MSHGPRTRGKFTVPEIAPKVAAIYARHSAGCCLHIVLDDGNVKDDNVRFCLDEAGRNGHPDCAELAQILLTMSKTQRLKLRTAAAELESDVARLRYDLAKTTDPEREKKVHRIGMLLAYRERERAKPATGFAPQDCQTSDSIFHSDWEIIEILYELGVLPGCPAQIAKHPETPERAAIIKRLVEAYAATETP